METKGMIALITGASRGIGESIAIRLAAMGMQIVITGRDADKLEQLKDHIQQIAPKPHIIVADISAPDTPGRLIGETIQMFGGIDLLVNNAGYAISKSLEETEFLRLWGGWDMCIRQPMQRRSML